MEFWEGDGMGSIPGLHTNFMDFLEIFTSEGVRCLEGSKWERDWGARFEIHKKPKNAIKNMALKDSPEVRDMHRWTRFERVASDMIFLGVTVRGLLIFRDFVSNTGLM